MSFSQSLENMAASARHSQEVASAQTAVCVNGVAAGQTARGPGGSHVGAGEAGDLPGAVCPVEGIQKGRVRGPLEQILGERGAPGWRGGGAGVPNSGSALTPGPREQNKARKGRRRAWGDAGLGFSIVSTSNDKTERT